MIHALNSALLPKALHIKTGATPEFRFEWHPEAKRVYVIRLGTSPEIGELIAFNIADHGSAINAVQIWARGYRTGTAGRPVETLSNI